MLLGLLCYKWHSMSQMLVIPHRLKKIGIHNLVVRRIFSYIVLVLGLKEDEKHCSKTCVTTYGTTWYHNTDDQTKFQEIIPICH
jgi:hypothetical protein